MSNVNSNYVKAWYNKGLAYYASAVTAFDKLERYCKAMNCYDQCLDINPNYVDALTSKGWVLYDLERYHEAIECYDKAILATADTAKSLIYFSRGESKFELGLYSSALEDFKVISDHRYDGQKHINMGLCYYQLGFHDDAEKQYREAINCNSELIEAYYNLAVLYCSENKIDKAKKLLETCLKVKREFIKARESLKKLNISDQLDWYDWWFGVGRSIKKKILGGFLLATVLSTITATAYASLFIKNANLTGLGVADGLLIVILLLPSLKKIKIVNVELETEPPGHKNIELEPAKSHLQPRATRTLDPKSISIASLQNNSLLIKRDLESNHI